MINKIIIGLNIVLITCVLGLGYQIKKLRETNTKIHKFTAQMALQFKKAEESMKPKDEMLAVGEKVPSKYVLKDAESNEISLPFSNDKKTLLVFSRPDCQYCEKFIPKIVAYAKEKKDKLNVLILEQGEPKDIKERSFGKESNVKLLVTEDVNIFNDFKIMYTPSTFLLDSTNTVLASGVFSSNEELEKLDEYLL